VFKGHIAPVNAVAFAPDSKTVASVSADTTALIWDVTKVDRSKVPAKALAAGDLETCWQALADNDAAKAFTRMGDLIAAPKDAVAWLKARVKPALPLDMKRVEALIGQLDDKRFKVREKAAAELLNIGDHLVPVIDKTLAANLSPETKRRLAELRGKLALLQDERLRSYRAVEVLERIGTPEARQVLRTLADGAPGALVTTTAKEALNR